MNAATRIAFVLLGDLTVTVSLSAQWPWTVRVNQRLLAADELIEFVCDENENDALHLSD